MSDSYRSAFIQVNEDVDSWQKVDFINTGEESGSGLAHRTVLVKLEEGAENTIEFGNTTDNAPSLDRINLFLLKDEDVPNEDISIKEPVNDVKIHTDERQIIIEYGANADYSIYNSLGQLIQSGNFYGTTTIPVGNSGVYIVKLNSGSIHHSEKVVIK
jgi:hypothetical protein